MITVKRGVNSQLPFGEFTNEYHAYESRRVRKILSREKRSGRGVSFGAAVSFFFFFEFYVFLDFVQFGVSRRDSVQKASAGFTIARGTSKREKKKRFQPGG